MYISYIKVWFNFPHLFLVPQESDLSTVFMEGYIMGLHGDVLPSWDTNLSSLVLIVVFLIHLAVQVQTISSTPLSPGWAPAVNLVL